MSRRRILIIRPDRIGDVILTTPLIREVKRTFPESFLGVMVGPSSEPLLRHNPHVDSIIVDDPSGADAGWPGFWRQVGRLRSERYTVGLMPLPRERHAWMMFWAGIGTRIGVGGKLYQLLTGTKSVSRRKYIPLRHEADYVMDLGRRIGVVTENLHPELFLTDAERAEARRWLEERGIDLSKPLIGLNPVSKNSAPNWPITRYRELAERLAARYQLFINTGMPGGTEAASLEGINGTVLLDAPPLRRLLAVTSCFSLLITPSTGTLHIAAALDVPTVALFCPLTACSPALWGPLGRNADVILPVPSYCQNECPGDPKVCPLDGTSLETVLSSVDRSLARG